MVHTQYHLRVSAAQLGGALSRLGAMLSAPLLLAERAAREVENVHAEYSRNRNSDARRLLQLRRSLARAPYAKFSTGSLETLRGGADPDNDAAAAPGGGGGGEGAEAAALRRLWRERYVAPATSVAVVGPQAPGELEALVRAAFSGMDARRCGGEGGGGGGEGGSGGDGAGSSGGGGGGEGPGGGGGAGAAAAGCRYGGLDVWRPELEGALLRVAPMRELRSLELSWYVPYGAMAHPDSKPWRVAGHVLVGFRVSGFRVWGLMIWGSGAVAHADSKP
jgi:secreted Zn-dependent insulinase-like peptidase